MLQDVSTCLFFDSLCTDTLPSVLSCHLAAIWAQSAPAVSQRGLFAVALRKRANQTSSISNHSLFFCVQTTISHVVLADVLHVGASSHFDSSLALVHFALVTGHARPRGVLELRVSRLVPFFLGHRVRCPHIRIRRESIPLCHSSCLRVGTIPRATRLTTCVSWLKSQQCCHVIHIAYSIVWSCVRDVSHDSLATIHSFGCS